MSFDEQSRWVLGRSARSLHFSRAMTASPPVLRIDAENPGLTAKFSFFAPLLSKLANEERALRPVTLAEKPHHSTGTPSGKARDSVRAAHRLDHIPAGFGTGAKRLNDSLHLGGVEFLALGEARLAALGTGPAGAMANRRKRSITEARTTSGCPGSVGMISTLNCKSFMGRTKRL
jgi:hypothetical protein